METRRSFIKKASLLSGSVGLMQVLPPSIQRALAIDPKVGSTFLDAEHIVLLMQENRSFDHTYGSLQGVRGFNDPRAIELPSGNKVWMQTASDGQTFAPFHLDIKNSKATWMSSLPHSWANQIDARNQGKFDKWLDAKHSGIHEYAEMPLTMGYYARQDIPFYYALADAFTVCDQHFCSSLTGTTPNRLHFWTGTIREKPDPKAIARVWNEDADHDTPVNWKTFPERLEEQGISWKVYQNEIDLPTGLTDEEHGWLANFGDNPLEYFTQYQARLSKQYIAYLPVEEKKLRKEIAGVEEARNKLTNGDPQLPNLEKKLAALHRALEENLKDQQEYTIEKYAALDPFTRNLHDKAFVANTGDPDYHALADLTYTDGDQTRTMRVPKGDVLDQFRKDVNSGKLPAVSWLVAPENFSDHPTSAWYGAWYISEVMDILTKNPDVWRKTIFILTYDENDGYFDHVPPFVSPFRPGTGKTSEGISTELEFVGKDQQSIADHLREGPIGLGYRVPMVIASPWSRGGWVCSEVFDHTSSLRFLEQFIEKKWSKKIVESNITPWRRLVCGDLSSSFRPWNGEAIELPTFLNRDEFVEGIHKAKFKNPPSNYRSLSAEDLALAKSNPAKADFLPKQEKGIRSSCALPYELYADGRVSDDKKSLVVNLTAGNKIFGTASLGSPFQVIVPAGYSGEPFTTRDYAVKPGDTLSDEWLLDSFAQQAYHLRIHGPNGFFRELRGTAQDPAISLELNYEMQNGRPTGNILLSLSDRKFASQLVITNNAYSAGNKKPAINGNQLQVFTAGSFGWYDFTVGIKDHPGYLRRWAGRVETGASSKTDPVMGNLV